MPVYPGAPMHRPGVYTEDFADLCQRLTLRVQQDGMLDLLGGQAGCPGWHAVPL